MRASHNLKHGFSILRVILSLCGVICVLAALLFCFFWMISEHRSSAEDKGAAVFFVVLVLVAGVISLVAAMRKR
jgi:hypothetical protein